MTDKAGIRSLFAINTLPEEEAEQNKARAVATTIAITLPRKTRTIS